MTAYTDREIAAVAWAANAELQALHGDPCPSLPGDAQDAEAHAVTVAGIRAILDGATPQQVHETWVRAREMQGWTHGPAKDSRLKTHPCLLPYRDLPEHQRVKDRVLRGIVLAMAGRDDAQEPGAAHDPDAVTAAARAQHAAYWASFGYSEPPVPWEALDPAEVTARLAGAEAALGASGLREKLAVALEDFNFERSQVVGLRAMLSSLTDRAEASRAITEDEADEYRAAIGVTS
jgi:hypothetical protein